MVRDLGENDRDDEIVDEPTPPSLEGETLSPTIGETSGDDDFAAEDDLAPDVTPELTPDVPTAELGGDEAAAAAESDTDLAAEQDSSSSAEPPGESPKAATQTDWSNFVPAPGYADPETGRPIFRYGNIDQAGCDLMLLVHGQRPLFEPESDESDVDETTPPPFLAGPPHGGGVPPFVPGNKPDGGASPSVSVDVRVSLGDGELRRVSNATIRGAAEFSRAELLVVARKLFELDDEIKAREQQRRVLARRY